MDTRAERRSVSIELETGRAIPLDDAPELLVDSFSVEDILDELLRLSELDVHYQARSQTLWSYICARTDDPASLHRCSATLKNGRH